MSATTERACWCGHPTLEPFSENYRVCRACGTLVSRASYNAELYNEDYWLKRQTEHHGLPDIRKRARLDLPERCTHWLRHLLSLRLPPAKVLEVGCAHGGYVALLGWAGFDAVGTELSPGVAHLAHELFGVKVLAGPVEGQEIEAGSLDVIVLNDVIEHLPDPVSTMRHCAGLLAPGGLFVIQTPEYKEHLAYAELVATNDLFLKHMDKKENEHLFLFSRRSVGEFFSRLGFPVVAFANPIFPYDLFVSASRSHLAAIDDAEISAALARKPIGRLAQALLDKDFESKDRWWAIRRLEEKLNSRLIS
jgi:2-polyprenyl-3-methyl-5-hydroxy-6-metoxy-1,4-benzoquinol methylase